MPVSVRSVSLSVTGAGTATVVKPWTGLQSLPVCFAASMFSS